MKNDTIAAIATAPGVGAISIVRLSGPLAFDIGEKIFSKPFRHAKSHTAHYGNILDSKGETIDNVLLLIMKNPHSYTGEDSIEISCHGGSLVTRNVLQRVLEAGARMAEPGEFSLRAFVNGKMDLAQAEAVQTLIGAKNDLALHLAKQQLQGALSEKIGSFQQRLTYIAAIIEAWVDFPEDDLEFAKFEELILQLEGIAHEMHLLKETFHNGKSLFEGFSLCLIGSPNVGKSSLMNAFLGKDRAIVTEIPGTTRDVLEEDLHLGQLHFKIIDTAGIRNTEEIVEKEGIRRSKLMMQEADVILLLLDASRELQNGDRELLSHIPKEKTIVLWNKTDIATPHRDVPGIAISALHKKGLNEVQAAVERLIWKEGPPAKDEILITKMRHYSALTNAISACESVIQGLKKQISAEFVASDLRTCLQELGSITGANVTEDILTAIFSQFCLGK